MNEFPTSPARTLTQSRDRVVSTPIVGFRGQLTASAAVLYTAPTIPTTNPTGVAHASALLKSIVLCNTDTTARTVTMYCIETGGSVADNRAIFKDLSVAAKSTAEYFYPDNTFPLGSAETIQGLADTTLKVTVRLGVVQLTN